MLLLTSLTGLLELFVQPLMTDHRLRSALGVPPQVLFACNSVIL